MTTQLPVWTFDDAYESLDSPRFTGELELGRQLNQQLLQQLAATPTLDNTTLLALLPEYEVNFDRLSSLQNFCRCMVSQNMHDKLVEPAQQQVSEQVILLDRIGGQLFDYLAELPAGDKLWQDERVKHWHFTVQAQQNHWARGIPEQKQAVFERLFVSNFIPLNGLYNKFNKRLRIEVTDSQGKTQSMGLAKCTSIMKGAPDPLIRANVFRGMADFYAKNQDVYSDLLNQLHGFRLAQFAEAKMDLLTPSLQQNRISEPALAQMYRCIEKRKTRIQDALRLRAGFFGQQQLATCDLAAPAPQQQSNDTIDYAQAQEVIQTALSEVDPELKTFIQMMLDKRWLEASLSDKKLGGGFYTRFNQLKQTRVFTTYMGTLAHLLQQSHELGHAWHYWIMRDLPSIETEFPMTLAETASLFNEAVVREWLLEHSESDSLRFAILWQELKSCANFLFNVSARYDFEIHFLEQRKKGPVTAQENCELMEAAWRKWYGDSTVDCDTYLWASKLHFYKTDQYIYNYPYTVGYLISQGLLYEKESRGEDFFVFYKALLRDTGRMSVDALIRKHCGYDITESTFWDRCLDRAVSYIDTFETSFVK